MQQFLVQVIVTVNTLEAVSSDDVKEQVQELVEDFDGGSIEVSSVMPWNE